jgi:NADH-ubiquinone oxidoreductase chain 1
MIEVQKSVWFIILVFPLYMIFFIASVAETNRAPFDLAEAESELVSGFMTEHAAGIFVFFFLAEYASIILMCILISVTLLGGYEIFSQIYFLESLLNIIINPINDFIHYMYNIDLKNDYFAFDINEIILNNLILSIVYTTTLALKSYALVFLFI